MDLTNSPTTASPESDNDTPPYTQPIRQFSYTNSGAAAAFQNYHHHQQPYVPVIYRECLRNHAASLGGHALDGCGDFLPHPTAIAAGNDPSSLTCVVCGCHRNFHRREMVGEYPPHFVTAVAPHFIDFRRPRRSSSSSSPPPPPPPTTTIPPPYPPPPPPRMLLSLSSTAAMQDDQQVPNHNHYTVATPVTPRGTKSSAERVSSGRKRFRTKFTQAQKEKMQAFADILGWKMQKCNQAVVENFCSEIGVTRGVLKVWMHNNKNTLRGKKDSNTSSAAGTDGGAGRRENGYNMNSSVNDDGDESRDDDDDNVGCGNGNGSSESPSS